MRGEAPRLRAVAALAVLVAAAGCAPVPVRAPQAQAQAAAADRSAPFDAAALAAAAPRVDASAAAAAYAGARTYSGVLSCAGCAQQRLTLTIFADGTFRLLQADGAGSAARGGYDIGRWATSTEAPDTIALRGDTDGVRLFRRVRPDGLAVVDNEGREIRGLDSATLARAARIDPLAGPLRLVGSYRLEGRQAVFVECLTGRRMPVVAGVPASGSPQAVRLLAGAQSALDAAHRAVRLAPEEPVLAVVQGYLLPRVVQPDDAEKEALVVAVFERAMRDARCEDVVRKAR